MTIKLRVVGIFYSVELDAKSVSGGSVQDVLDAAVKNPGSDRKFGYISSVGTLEPPSLSLSTFSAVYNSPFKSKVSGIEYQRQRLHIRLISALKTAIQLFGDLYQFLLAQQILRHQN